MQLVEPQSQIIPGIVSVEKKKPSISGVQRRMGLAYDKLVMAAEEREASLSPKTIRTLGRLVLEFEQVNENLASIQAQIRQDIREKKRIFDEEKKLNKKEEDNLTSLRAGLFETRGKIAAFSALVAGKALLEGRVGDAAQSGALAIGAMLPEIVSIASTLVLGRLALGRGAGAVAGSVARGGMRMPGGLGMLGLGAAATVPFAMAGSASAADERRRELVRRQTETSSISSEDVERFQSILNRFDAIISRTGGAEAKDAQKVAQEDPRGTDDTKPPSPPGPAGDVFAGDILADTPEEKAFIATVRETEGTASKDGYNKFFGGSLYGGDLSKKTVQEVAELQKKFLREGKGRFYDAGAGKYRQSAAVGAGQFLRPEDIARAMGMDPAKVMFDEAFQNAAMLYLARKKRGVDPSKPLTLDDIRKLNPEWSGLGPYYGQTNRTVEQSLKIYEQNLREARPKLDPAVERLNKELEAERNVQEIKKQKRNARGDVSFLQIPAKTNVAKPSGPKSTPSSTNVAFNNTFESVDKLQSQVTLGVFG